jgi:hypothetical protein
VRFVFPKKAEGGARVRRPHSAEQLLPLNSAEADEGFPAVTYRFTPGAERGQVATANAPLAILPIFE